MFLGDLTELTVDEILAQWPQTAQVFRRYRLACVGCVIGPYCDMDTVADTYNIPKQQFLDELYAAIQRSNKEDY